MELIETYLVTFARPGRNDCENIVEIVCVCLASFMTS